MGIAGRGQDVAEDRWRAGNVKGYTQIYGLLWVEHKNVYITHTMVPPLRLCDRLTDAQWFVLPVTKHRFQHPFTPVA